MRYPLDIPPGINADDTKSSYPGTWSDGDSVRFWFGKPQPIGGWESITTSLLTGVCRSILPWVDNDNLVNIAFGQHDQLSVYRDNALYNITPTSGFTAGNISGTGGAGYGTGAYGTGDYGEPSAADYFALTWSLANRGETLMANPRGQKIFWWQNNTATRAATLTNAPANVTYVLVPYTRQVLAFGCNEVVSGTFNPMCIRGSDALDPEDWTPDGSNLAFEQVLDGGGRIVAAQVIGDAIFVWTNTALFVGVATGDSTQSWQFNPVADDCGLIGPNAATVVGQTAFWFAPTGRFYACSLGGVPQQIQVTTGNEMTNNIASSQGDKIVCASIAPFNEIWWLYPDGRDGNEVSRYVSYSIGNGWASKGTMARTAFVDCSTASNQYPIGVTVGGNIYYHEKGNSADGGAVSCFIETSNFSLNEQDDSVMMVRGIWPDFKDQMGNISVTTSSGLYQQSPFQEFGPYVMGTADSKIDFRNSGRFFRLRLSSNSAPTFWRMGRPSFDAVRAGAR